jgi:hypothetical protein
VGAIKKAKTKKKAETLPIKKFKRVLGLDPGVVNFGATLLIDGKPNKTFWVKAQQNIYDDGVFINNIIDIIRETKPDLIIAERYQFRGLQSVYVEVVSQMLGRLSIITRILFNKELVQITAAQWKNFYKVKKLKNGVWSLFPNCRIFEEIHQVDAAAIGKYGWETLDSRIPIRFK